MSIIFNAVIPLFAIILAGFVAGRMNLLPNSAASSLNSFVYYFSLPALLFFSIATAPVNQLTNANFILANILLIIGFYLFTIIFFKIVYKKPLQELTMYGMMTTYGNTGFLGIPLIIAIFGQAAAIPVAISILIYDLVILIMVISSFEVLKQKSDGDFLQTIKVILKSVFLNPINGSLLIGFSIAFLQIPTPEPLLVFADTLGAAAGPTALFSLGLGLASQRKDLLSYAFRKSEMFVLLLFKLILLPLFAYFLVYLVFPVNNHVWAATIVILSSLPTGAMVNVFSERYQTLTREVPAFILLSTVLSLFSTSIILLWIL
ncbi:AEC family transporter [Ornithinibacillus halophilus]|uniref:Transporter n=1 Tax=Ornithinibacillus halophilus TaxID=930117 RepID=A0A1M5E0A3_9BACI|nr:AEC family transporter [Ornithinibacillus halophilus]SHF72501.1 hypothetical protein SAMN05216225_100371 [Ornithinibacillus halophilus]